MSLVVVLAWCGPLVAQDSPTEPVVISKGPFALDRPIPVRVTLEDGRRVEGGATSWSREGFTGPFGAVQWRHMAPPERYRLRREMMRASGLDTLEGWTALAIDIRAIGDSQRLSSQALNRAKLLAGRELAEAVVAQIEKESTRLQTQWAEEAARREAQTLKSGPPHMLAAATTAWPIRDSDIQAKEAERVRSRAIELAAGLKLNPAQSASVVALGQEQTQQVAVLALRMDDLHELLAVDFGAENKVNIFPGVVALLVVPTITEFRLLAAEQFRHDIPKDATAAFFVDDGIPFVMVVDQEEPRKRIEDVVRMYTLAFLHYHISARGLPPWIESGLGDYYAQQFVRDSTIDQDRRYRALAGMRSGTHPGWLLKVKADDESLWPDGPGRDLSYLLVTRMMENNPEGMRSFIREVKGGAPVKDAFARAFRISPASYMNDSARWFQFND